MSQLATAQLAVAMCQDPQLAMVLAQAWQLQSRACESFQKSCVLWVADNTRRRTKTDMDGVAPCSSGNAELAAARSMRQTAQPKAVESEVCVDELLELKRRLQRAADAKRAVGAGREVKPFRPDVSVDELMRLRHQLATRLGEGRPAASPPSRMTRQEVQAMETAVVGHAIAVLREGLAYVVVEASEE